jgi:hypothetical protein
VCWFFYGPTGALFYVLAQDNVQNRTWSLKVLTLTVYFCNMFIGSTCSSEMVVAPVNLFCVIPFQRTTLIWSSDFVIFDLKTPEGKRRENHVLEL